MSSYFSATHIMRILNDSQGRNRFVLIIETDFIAKQIQTVRSVRLVWYLIQLYAGNLSRIGYVKKDIFYIFFLTNRIIAYLVRKETRDLNRQQSLRILVCRNVPSLMDEKGKGIYRILLLVYLYSQCMFKFLFR